MENRPQKLIVLSLFQQTEFEICFNRKKSFTSNIKITKKCLKLIIYGKLFDHLKFSLKLCYKITRLYFFILIVIIFIIILFYPNRDPYNLIDSESDDYFGTANRSNFFIEFVFKEAITMNGIIIQSSFRHFPRSFDIEVEGKIVKSIEDAGQLNDKFKKMMINFNSIRGKKIKFIQTGLNWDDTRFLYFDQFEVLSSENQFSECVFKSFMNDVEDGDPHTCPVLIFTNHFDSNFFYEIDGKSDVCIPNTKDPWVQIELTKGYAILKGFRIARDVKDKLKSYKIICTDNPNKSIHSWTTLFSIDEDSIISNPFRYTQEFDKPSPPTRFVRIVLTGKARNDKTTLRFSHFELFGTYL